MGHAGVGWITKGWVGQAGWGRSYRGGVGDAGVEWVILGWGGVVMGWGMWGGSCWGGLG